MGKGTTTSGGPVGVLTSVLRNWDWKKFGEKFGSGIWKKSLEKESRNGVWNVERENREGHWKRNLEREFGKGIGDN